MDGILALAEKQSVDIDVDSTSSVSNIDAKLSTKDVGSPLKKGGEPEPHSSKSLKPTKKVSSSSTLVMLLLRSYSSFPLLNSLNNAPATITKCFGHLLKTGQFAPAIK